MFHHCVLGAVSLPLCDKAEQSAVSITCNFTLVISIVARATVLEAEVCRDQQAHEVDVEPTPRSRCAESL